MPLLDDGEADSSDDDEEERDDDVDETAPAQMMQLRGVVGMLPVTPAERGLHLTHYYSPGVWRRHAVAMLCSSVGRRVRKPMSVG